MTYLIKLMIKLKVFNFDRVQIIPMGRSSRSIAMDKNKEEIDVSEYFMKSNRDQHLK